MADVYDNGAFGVGQISKRLGFENPSALSVTAAYTLLTSDPRTVSADTTSAAFNLDLPPYPYDGMEYRIFDGAAAGSWNTNNLTIRGVVSAVGKQIIVSGSAAADTVARSTRSGSIVLRYYSTSGCWHQIL